MQAVFFAMCMMCQPDPYFVPGVGLSYESMINQYSDVRLVHRHFAYRVAEAESRFKPKAKAKHRFGASRGLFQINTKHEHELVKKAGIKRFDWTDARQSAWVGIAYLSRLLKKYHHDYRLVLAGYNFGPGNVDNGKIWPKETRDYVRRILR